MLVKRVKVTNQMEIYQNSQIWLKPYGTEITCIDSMDQVCHSNLTLNECKKSCEDDPYCQGGYYLTYPDGKRSSCIRLNRTHTWANTHLLSNLLDGNNDSPISIANGFQMSVFYNPFRFPLSKDLPSDFSTFLFSGAVVFLVWDQKYYMDTNLQFQLSQTLSNSFSIRLAFSVPMHFLTRLHKDHSLNIYQKNSILRLAEYQQSFLWQPLIGSHVSTIQTLMVDPNQEWINENIPFYLLYTTIEFPNQPFYIDVDESTMILRLTHQKPKKTFSFLLDPDNFINQYRNQNFKNINPTHPQLDKESNDIFINPFFDHYFPTLSAYHASSIPPWTDILMILNWILLSIFLLTCLEWIFYQWKKRI